MPPPPPLPASVIRRILDMYDVENVGRFARIRKLLWISRTCKAWRSIAEQVAFRHVVVRIGDGRSTSRRLLVRLWTTPAHASHLRKLEADLFVSRDSQKRKITLASFASLLVSLSAYRDLSSNKARGLDSLWVTISVNGPVLDVEELPVVSTALRTLDSLRHLQVHVNSVDLAGDDGNLSMTDHSGVEQPETTQNVRFAVNSLQIGNEAAQGDDEEPDVSLAFAQSFVQPASLQKLILLNVAHVDSPFWLDRLVQLQELQIVPTTYSASRDILEALLLVLPRLKRLAAFYLKSAKLAFPFVSPHAVPPGSLSNAFARIPLLDVLAAIPKKCSFFQIDHLICDQPKLGDMPLLVAGSESALPRLPVARLYLRISNGDHAAAAKQDIICRLVELDGSAAWALVHIP